VLASLMLALHSASRRGAPCRRVGSRVVQTAQLVILTTEHTQGPRKFHGAVAARSDDEAAKAVFEARGMEVHQQTDTKMTHTSVGEKLVLMSGEKRGDGFDFENDSVFNYDVGTKARWDSYAFANDGTVTWASNLMPA
jgi:hypothetical protein